MLAKGTILYLVVVLSIAFASFGAGFVDGH